MNRSGKLKGRSGVTYKHKVNRMKKWYIKREKDRAILKKLAEAIMQKKDLDKAEERLISKYKNLKPIQPLESYIEKIKQPNQSR